MSHPKCPSQPCSRSPTGAWLPDGRSGSRDEPTQRQLLTANSSANCEFERGCYEAALDPLPVRPSPSDPGEKCPGRQETINVHLALGTKVRDNRALRLIGQAYNEEPCVSEGNESFSCAPH